MATTVDRRTWLLEVADDRRGPQQLQAMFASSTSYNFVLLSACADYGWSRTLQSRRAYCVHA
jgi:hypothetical protein